MAVRRTRPGANAHDDGAAEGPWLRVVGATFLLAGVIVGCFAGDDAAGGLDDDYMDDPPPPGGCDTDCPEPGSDGNPVGGPCTDSSDCAAGGICSAQFDGEVQSFECQAECIPLMDQQQWCADDSSCCTVGAICSARGFCIVPGDTEGLDSGSGTDGDSGGSSGSGTGGSSDSGGRGSTGSGGSSTGGGTGSTG